jgi:phosphomannomutase
LQHLNPFSQRYFFNPSIVKDSEINGEMGNTLKTEDALAFGQAIGNMYFAQGARIVCVAYDERLSSSALEEEICRGLAWEGLYVLRLGHCTTAVAHFTMKMLEAHLAIVVTGGSSPANCSGFRIFDTRGPLHGQRILDVTSYAKIGFNHNVQTGGIVSVNAINIYQEHMISQDNSSNSAPIVWNCAGGSIASLLHDIVHKIPGNHLLINDNSLDYPTSYDTISEGLKQLKDIIIEEEAAFGFLFNSDASSLIIVDEKGQTLPTFTTASIIVDTFIKKHHNNKPSSIVSDTLAPLDFTRKLLKNQHTLHFADTSYASAMAELINLDATVSITSSGYFGFGKPLHGCPDGLLAAITFLEFTSAQSQDFSLSEYIENQKEEYLVIPPFSVPTPFPSQDAILSIAHYLSSHDIPHHKGKNLRIESKSGWWHVSAPENHEEHRILIRAEADSQDDINSISQNIEEILNACSISTS